jgi:hypothetical protein
LGIGFGAISDRVLRAISTCASWRTGVGIWVGVDWILARLVDASRIDSSGHTSTANEFVDVRVNVNLSGPGRKM